MKQKAPTFGRTFDADMISQIISLDKKLIEDRSPIQEVSTVFYALIIPLKTMDAVKKDPSIG